MKLKKAPALLGIFAVITVLHIQTQCSAPKRDAGESLEQLKEAMQAKYQDKAPQEWGAFVTGVKTRLDTGEKVVALTFDACGSGGLSNGYDAALIAFLAREKIPATLFVNSRWIDANPDVFWQLAGNPLFEIENHGHWHRPLSVNGKAAYGINGTSSIGEVVEEVELSARKIARLTGKKPKYFRSGTAYYDEIAVMIVQDLGYEAVNFSVLGDAGATYTKEQVVNAFRHVSPGAIMLFHMNHPESGTAEGVMEGVRELRRQGFQFVKLDACALK